MTASHQHIEAEEIERARLGSSSEIMGLVNGVRIVQHGAEGKGHQIFLRGFDAAHGSDVEVLVEGISLNEPLNVHGHGYVDLYGIVPEVVERLQVSKGPFLDSQGDFAMAGTVEFELGLSARLRPGLVRMGVGHRGWLRGVAVAAPEGWGDGGFAAAETVYDAGFGPDREARRAALDVGSSFKAGDDGKIRALLLGQSARFESPGAVRLEDVTDRGMGFYDTYGPAGAGLSDRVMGKVGWEVDTDRTDFEVDLHGSARRFGLEENFTGWIVDRERGDRRRQLVDSGSVGMKGQLEHRFAAPFPLALRSGLGWRFDAGRQQEIHVDVDGEDLVGTRDVEARRHHVEARLGFRMAPVRWLEAQPSARLDLFRYDVEDRLADRSGDETLVAVSPRIAIAIPVHRALTLFAAYGRGFRSPEARSVVALPAGEVEDEGLSAYDGGRLEIAACDGVEVGVKIEPGPTFSIELSGFATWIEREIVFDHVSNLNLEMNGTRRAGAELGTRIDPLPWLDLDADLTFVDARFVESGAFVPGSAKWQGSAGIFLGLDRGPRGGAQLTWASRRFLAHGATVEGFAMLDLVAGWRFEHFDVAVLVDNATGSKSMEGAYHYASWFDRDEPRSAIPVIHYVAAQPLTARFVLTAFL